MAASMRTRWLALVGVLLVFELALSRVWPLLDDNDPPPGLEQQLALAAALLLLTLPHSIAWLGRRRRWLLSVGGTLGIVLTVVSVLGFSLIFVTIPFVLIPSIVYLMRSGSTNDRRGAVAGLTAAVIALAIGATAAFFLTEDPRCSITVRREGKLVHDTPASCDPYNSGRLGPEVVEWSGSSDAIAWHESFVSISLSGIALGLCVRSGPATRERGRTTVAVAGP